MSLSREAIIAELQRRGVSVPAAGGSPVQTTPAQPATPKIPRDAIIAELKRRGVAIPGQPEEPGMLSQIGRQVGLAGRYAVEGALSLPGIIANAGAGLSNAVLGTRFPDQNQAVSQGLSKLGFPEPQGTTEQIVGHASRALASTGGTFAVGRILGEGEAAAKAVGQTLTANPLSQVGGSVGSGAAVGVAQEGGGSPSVQAAAGLVGGITGGSVPAVAGAAARGVGAVRDAFTQAGNERIAGRVLNQAASNPGQAVRTMQAAQEFVPGSMPTTGEASRDLGLISLQKTITERSKGELGGNPFAQRAQAQNAARVAALDDIAGDANLVTGMQRARNALGDSMREASLPPPGTVRITTAPVISRIDELLKSPKGANEHVQRSLTWVKNQILKEASAEGAMDGDPARLYEIGKNLNERNMRSLGAEFAGAKQAAASLADVRKVLYKAIDDTSPGFNEYLKDYAKLSKPIDQRQTLQRIKADVQTPATDAAGDPIISQAKWSRVVKGAMPRLEKDLSPKQIEVLKTIGDDLDRGSILTNAHVRSTGSDTLRNLTGANLMGAIASRNMGFTNALGETALKPFGWLMSIPNRNIENLLQEAMLKPSLAAQLMKPMTPKGMFNLAASLKALAREMGVETGSSVGRQVRAVSLGAASGTGGAVR